MLSINGNNIILTRGDTLTLNITLTKDGEPYAPPETDVIRLACAKGFAGAHGYQLIFEKNIPYDTLTVTIPAETTGAMCYGTYNYDVEITHDDGCVDTVIAGTIRITGEVE